VGEAVEVSDGGESQHRRGSVAEMSLQEDGRVAPKCRTNGHEGFCGREVSSKRGGTQKTARWRGLVRRRLQKTRGDDAKTFVRSRHGGGWGRGDRKSSVVNSRQPV